MSLPASARELAKANPEELAAVLATGLTFKAQGGTGHLSGIYRAMASELMAYGDFTGMKKAELTSLGELVVDWRYDVLERLDAAKGEISEKERLMAKGTQDGLDKTVTFAPVKEIKQAAQAADELRPAYTKLDTQLGSISQKLGGFSSALTLNPTASGAYRKQTEKLLEGLLQSTGTGFDALWSSLPKRSQERKVLELLGLLLRAQAQAADLSIPAQRGTFGQPSVAEASQALEAALAKLPPESPMREIVKAGKETGRAMAAFKTACDPASTAVATFVPSLAKAYAQVQELAEADPEATFVVVHAGWAKGANQGYHIQKLGPEAYDQLAINARDTESEIILVQKGEQKSGAALRVIESKHELEGDGSKLFKEHSIEQIAFGGSAEKRASTVAAEVLLDMVITRHQETQKHYRQLQTVSPAAIDILAAATVGKTPAKALEALNAIFALPPARSWSGDSKGLLDQGFAWMDVGVFGEFLKDYSQAMSNMTPEEALKATLALPRYSIGTTSGEALMRFFMTSGLAADRMVALQETEIKEARELHTSKDGNVGLETIPFAMLRANPGLLPKLAEVLDFKYLPEDKGFPPFKTEAQILELYRKSDMSAGEAAFYAMCLHGVTGESIEMGATIAVMIGATIALQGALTAGLAALGAGTLGAATGAGMVTAGLMGVHSIKQAKDQAEDMAAGVGAGFRSKADYDASLRAIDVAVDSTIYNVLTAPVMVFVGAAGAASTSISPLGKATIAMGADIGQYVFDPDTIETYKQGRWSDLAFGFAMSTAFNLGDMYQGVKAGSEAKPKLMESMVQAAIVGNELHIKIDGEWQIATKTEGPGETYTVEIGGKKASFDLSQAIIGKDKTVTKPEALFSKPDKSEVKPDTGGPGPSPKPSAPSPDPAATATLPIVPSASATGRGMAGPSQQALQAMPSVSLLTASGQTISLPLRPDEITSSGNPHFKDANGLDQPDDWVPKIGEIIIHRNMRWEILAVEPDILIKPRPEVTTGAVAGSTKAKLQADGRMIHNPEVLSQKIDARLEYLYQNDRSFYDAIEILAAAAKSDTERVFIYRAVGAGFNPLKKSGGYDIKAITEFALTIRDMPPDQIIRDYTMTTARQYFKNSCVPASFQVAKAQSDPIYASILKTNPEAVVREQAWYLEQSGGKAIIMDSPAWTPELRELFKNLPADAQFKANEGSSPEQPMWAKILSDHYGVDYAVMSSKIQAGKLEAAGIPTKGLQTFANGKEALAIMAQAAESGFPVPFGMHGHHYVLLPYGVVETGAKRLFIVHEPTSGETFTLDLDNPTQPGTFNPAAEPAKITNFHVPKEFLPALDDTGAAPAVVPSAKMPDDPLPGIPTAKQPDDTLPSTPAVKKPDDTLPSTPAVKPPTDSGQTLPLQDAAKNAAKAVAVKAPEYLYPLPQPPVCQATTSLADVDMPVSVAPGPGTPPDGKGVVLKNDGQSITVMGAVGAGGISVAGKQFTSPDGVSFYRNHTLPWNSPPYAIKLNGKAFQLTKTDVQVNGQPGLRLIEDAASIPDISQLKPPLDPPPALMSTVQWPPPGPPGPPGPPRTYLVTTEGLKEVRDLPIDGLAQAGPVLTTDFQGETVTITDLMPINGSLTLTVQSPKAQAIQDIVPAGSKASYYPLGGNQSLALSRNAGGEVEAAYKLKPSQILGIDGPPSSAAELKTWIKADEKSEAQAWVTLPDQQGKAQSFEVTGLEGGQVKLRRSELFTVEEKGGKLSDPRLTRPYGMDELKPGTLVPGADGHDYQVYETLRGGARTVSFRRSEELLVPLDALKRANPTGPRIIDYSAGRLDPPRGILGKVSLYLAKATSGYTIPRISAAAVGKPFPHPDIPAGSMTDFPYSKQKVKASTFCVGVTPKGSDLPHFVDVVIPDAGMDLPAGRHLSPDELKAYALDLLAELPSQGIDALTTLRFNPAGMDNANMCADGSKTMDVFPRGMDQLKMQGKGSAWLRKLTDDYFLQTGDHEMGHLLAKKYMGDFAGDPAYRQAIDRDGPQNVPSPYGGTANEEDLAESLRQYLRSQGGTTAYFDKRGAPPDWKPGFLDGAEVRKRMPNRFAYWDAFFQVKPGVSLQQRALLIERGIKLLALLGGFGAGIATDALVEEEEQPVASEP
ncbi:MAG: hypothetical protein ACAI44_21165 [Candidatus Sericytochromatia bacterium]